MKYLDYPELELLSRALTFETADVRVFTRLEAYSCKAVSRERRLLRALERHYTERAAAQRDAHQLLSRSVDGEPPARGASLLSASVPTQSDTSLSLSLSLPDTLDEGLLDSAFGPLDDPQARKVLFTLITALNLAFPDHDFSAINPADFRAEPSPHGVLSSLSTTLRHLSSVSGTPRSFSALPGALPSILGVASPSSPTSSSYPSAVGPGAQLASVVDDIMDTNDCEVFTFHPSLEADPHATGEVDTDEMEPAPLGVGSEYDDLGSEDDWAQEAHAMPPVPIHHAHRRKRSEDDDLVFDEDYDQGALAPGDGSSPPSEASDSEDGDDDTSAPPRGDSEGQGAGGNVLWTTYAFFYNRRLKRLLFVNVWARRVADVSTLTQVAEMAPRRRPSQASPLLGPAPVPAPEPVSFAEAGAALKPATPARRALARGARQPSRSPGPSANSPFPHDSPRSSGSVLRTELHP